MRFAVPLLLMVFVFICPSSFAQRVSIAQSKISLRKIFNVIQQQTGFSILYDNRLIKHAPDISINMQDAELKAVLDFSLKGLPLTYVITDKIIVIRENLLEKEAVSTSCVLRGFVRDENGLPLEAASVLIRQGKKGASTRPDGSFEIEHLSCGEITVVVSVVGYISEEKTLTTENLTEPLQFQLQKANNNLSEITITALGISRKARSLTYSTQTVTRQELTTVKSTNVMNSLNGKVAGVQINRTSGGLGGSVRVVIRGDKSTRNSQPLYVIDGMPIINPIGGPDAGLYNAGPDAGDIVSTINPDDIESVNVLKGASASALYGSQGSNGVILITTRKGKQGTSRVDFSSNMTMDRVSVLPKLQHEYGQSAPATDQSPGSEDSWGAKLATPSDGSYLKNFFQTGFTFINNISVTSGNDKSSNYLSYSNTENRGILPTSTYRQHTLSFRQTSKFLNDKLTIEASALGTLQRAHNRLTPGVYFNPLTGLYLFPRGLDFNSYKNFEYFSPSRYLNAQRWWNINHDKDLDYGGWGGQDYQQNPYWVLHRNPVDNYNQNVYASASLKYQVSNWLTVQARGNLNNFVVEYERHLYATTQATLSSANGMLRKVKAENSTYYGDMILQGERSLNSDLSINFTAGASIQHQTGKSSFINGSPSVANVFLESAIDRTNSAFDIRNGAVSRQIQSLFANAQLSYRNKLFLDLADRNDWSSTLAFTPTKRKGYNYYSIGAGVVLNEMIKLPPLISFAKLRASYAIVGNDIAPFSTKPLNIFGNGGVAIPPTSSTITIPGYYLKPEKNRSIELGAQVVLRDGWMSFDFTWYKSNIINQYFKRVTVPPGLGTGGYADINAGNIQNTGFEAIWSWKPLSSRRFNWQTTLNMSSNKNRIVELFNTGFVTSPEDQYYILYAGTDNFEGVLTKGGSYGDLYGRKLQRDPKGFVVVNSNTGIPYFVDNAYLGNPNPRLIAGWKNTINLKRFTLSFLIDGKFGGKVLSKTEGYLDQMGVSQKTAANNRLLQLPNVIDNNGMVYTRPIEAKAFYQAVGGKGPVDELYLHDATAVRLRECYLAYSVSPTNKLLKELSVGITGSNLFFFYLKAPYDPEQVAGVNPNGVGVDTFGMPAFRSMGLFFKCSF